MSASFMRGALVQFMPTILVPLPNVIVFQFNPETIAHRMTPPTGPGGATAGAPQAATPRAHPLAASGMPGETFSFTLTMDSNDSIASHLPISGGLAHATGLYTRLAALEMLLYPSGAFDGGLLGSVSAAAAAPAPASVPESQLSIVLFVWGPMRIMPVRVTGLSITERLYDGLLRPTHAEAQIELSVLTPAELAVATGPLAEVAKVAYGYTQALRQGFALANLANAAESVVGMLPV